MLRRFRPICEYHETDGYPMAVMTEIDSGEYVLFADYKNERSVDDIRSRQFGDGTGADDYSIGGHVHNSALRRIRALEKENSDLLAQCGGMEMTINELTEDLKIARDNSWEAREFGSTPSGRAEP